MTQMVEAIFDGSVLRPQTTLALEPNTRVRLTVEVLPAKEPDPTSFLRTARSLGLSGPVDWASEVDGYLYGEGDRSGDEVFLDTSYALALSAPTDMLHPCALRLADELEQAKARLVTTRAVLLEIGNALSRQRYRSAAIRLLRALESDTTVEIISLQDDLYTKALELYTARPDKEWGLIDCVSFVVMTERNLAKALTADEHYRQCGFRALLREEAE